MILLDIKIYLHLHDIAPVNFPHTDHLSAWQPLDVFLSQTSENIQLACVHILLPSSYHLHERCGHNLDFKTYYKLLEKILMWRLKRHEELSSYANQVSTPLQRLPKHDRVLILSDNYHLLLPATTLPLLWAVGGVGYTNMTVKVMGSGNWYFSDKMTLYNLITVTKEQMTNHNQFHSPGKQLNIQMTFHMAFFLLFIYFFGWTAATSLNIIWTGYSIELKQSISIIIKAAKEGITEHN